MTSARRRPADAPAEQTEDEPTLAGNRAFLLLWTGSSLSTLGSRITAFAWPVAIVQVTGSVFAGGAVLAAQMGGSVLATIVAGVLADARDRRAVLVLSTLTQAFLLGLAATLLALGVRVWPPFVVLAFLVGVSGSPVGPAAHSALRDVVPRSLVAKAKAMIEVRSQVANLAGPALGAALLTVASFAPLLADAVSYAAWAVAAAFVTLPRVEVSVPSTGSRWRDLTHSVVEGWRRLFDEVALKALVRFAAFANFAITLATSTLILRLTASGEPAGRIAVIPTSAAVLGVAGGLVAQRLLSRFSLGTLVLANAATMVLVTPVLVFDTNVVHLAVALGLLTFPEPAIDAGTFAYQAAKVEGSFQGRVFSAIRLLVMGPVIAGGVCAGLVAQLPRGLAHVVVGGTFLLCSLVCVLDGRLRRIGHMKEWAKE